MRCLLFFPVKPYQPKPAQSGFTLIELLVVIFLLGIIAGAIVVSYDGVGTQAQYDATKYEMTEIRKALIQFRRDSGSHSFPNQNIYSCAAIPPDNFPDEAGTTLAEQRAWCESPANFWMLFKDPLDNNSWDPDTHRGWNGPYLQRKSQLLTYLSIADVWGISDPYQSPYIFKDMSINNKARIVSIGQDNLYNGEDTTPCVPPVDTDDTVLCLLR